MAQLSGREEATEFRRVKCVQRGFQVQCAPTSERAGELITQLSRRKVVARGELGNARGLGDVNQSEQKHGEPLAVLLLHFCTETNDTLQT